MSFIFVFAELVYRTNDTAELVCQQCDGVVEAANNWIIMRRGPDDIVYMDDIKLTNSSIQVSAGEKLEFKNLDTYSEGQYSCQRSTGMECLAGCIFIQGNILYYVELGGTAWEVERGFGTFFHLIWCVHCECLNLKCE